METLRTAKKRTRGRGKREKRRSTRNCVRNGNPRIHKCDKVLKNNNSEFTCRKRLFIKRFYESGKGKKCRERGESCGKVSGRSLKGGTWPRRVEHPTRKFWEFLTETTGNNFLLIRNSQCFSVDFETQDGDRSFSPRKDKGNFEVLTFVRRGGCRATVSQLTKNCFFFLKQRKIVGISVLGPLIKYFNKFVWDRSFVHNQNVWQFKLEYLFNEIWKKSYYVAKRYTKCLIILNSTHLHKTIVLNCFCYSHVVDCLYIYFA